MEKIIATKKDGEETKTVEKAVYEVLTEETRVDEAGNEYKFTRKEVICLEDIDQKIANLQLEIDERTEKIELLNKTKAKLK